MPAVRRRGAILGLCEAGGGGGAWRPAGPSGERCAGAFALPPGPGASTGRRGRRPAMESEYYGGDQSGTGAGASPVGGTPAALGPGREGAGHGGALRDRPALPCPVRPAAATGSRGPRHSPWCRVAAAELCPEPHLGGRYAEGARGRAGPRRLRPGGSQQPAPQGSGVTSAGPGRVPWRDRSTAAALLLVRCFDEYYQSLLACVL